MKKLILPILSVFFLSSCAELQQATKQLNEIQNQGNQGGGIGQTQIANALKEALELGVSKQVVNLTKTNGFYNNSLVKIPVPQELQKVEKALRAAGLGSLADEGVKAMNNAASVAVKEATPIFVDAIKNMTITDAKNILMGGNNSATQYLKKSTTKSLYGKFNPIIKSSFNKVGADKVWKEIITTYNTLPMVQKVNPDLTDYVTNEALDGVFTMIGKEEVDIRTNINARSTNLLKSVFALQDKK
ncbi:DUF4197 domain-containing protein [Paenimyroides tangerinum]|uniref:DUF4197 domain-containing protein n=1 Tax=Paenimyroides tangerinum TaxID=2488728 RepID=A0A3P3W4J8_9FLAO|nr:DUF4197 domain-containing protein [Paenimyroides tangerinum]RRJ89338.1 DUF4197 domain-containing protein [Paenimyroides tangerinum]